MIRRKRLTNDQLFKLADGVYERWGTVTVQALQNAAGGGSASRLKTIIAEWKQQRDGSSSDLAPEKTAADPETPSKGTYITVDDTAEKASSQTSYNKLLKELQETRRANAEETARLNRLIDTLLEELQARRGADQNRPAAGH